MNSASDEQRMVEIRKLASLKAHPLQREFFDDLPDPDLQALAADIKRRGLQERIEILPDGTIISGHQRRLALLLLGYTEFEVIVRYDLADAGENAVTEMFLAANLQRRQLDTLLKAKVALGHYDAVRGRKTSQSSWKEINDAREHVGKLIGMSGRNLRRYWNALQAPLEVQQAFRRGQVRLVDAGRIGQLPDQEKKKIAAAIRGGADPRMTVHESLQKNDQHDRRKPIRSVVPQFRKAVKTLSQAVETISITAATLRNVSPESRSQVDAAYKTLRQVLKSMDRNVPVDE